MKLIDAKRNLSIQVHPDDTTARRHGLTCGKTEMWYVLPSSPDAFLYCGVIRAKSGILYRKMIHDGTICNALACYSVKEGDVFYIPAGSIHGVGGGCLLVEVQQTSDVTYRIYDFNRKDENGNLRPLNIDKALESVSFGIGEVGRIDYMLRSNCSCELVKCPYFVSTIYDVSEMVCINQKQMDSFMILVGVSGELIVKTDDEAVPLHCYETLLLAAENDMVYISGIGKVLEIHIM